MSEKPFIWTSASIETGDGESIEINSDVTTNETDVEDCFEGSYSFTITFFVDRFKDVIIKAIHYVTRFKN